MLDITFSYFFESEEFFVRERRSSEIRIKGVSSDIILEIIMFCAPDIYGHIFYIVSGMESLGDGCPVFVIDTAFEKQLQQFLETIIEFRRLRESDGVIIAMQGMLNVYGYIIQDPVLDHPFDYLIVPPVGIELDEEPHFLDPLGEIVEIRPQGRFAAADTDAVEQSFPSVEEIEERFLRDEIVLEKHHLLR